MKKERTDDIVVPEEEAGQKVCVDFRRQTRLFMEMMEDVYGQDVRKRFVPAVLIARHREVAAKLMLIKTDLPRRSDLFAMPKAMIRDTDPLN